MAKVTRYHIIKVLQIVDISKSISSWCKRTDHGAKQSPLIISASMFGKSSAETRQHPPMSKAPSFT